MGWDRPLFYNRSGEPIDTDEFERLYTGPGRVERITVAKTRIGYVEVSTVWLGVDYGFTIDGPPIIFETMTFVGHPSPDDNCRDQWDSTILDRYATEREAWEGHQIICRLVLDYLTGRQLTKGNNNA